MKSNKESSQYVQYCYFNLMKYQPWKDYPENVYGGERNEMHQYYVQNVPETIEMFTHGLLLNSFGMIIFYFVVQFLAKTMRDQLCIEINFVGSKSLRLISYLI